MELEEAEMKRCTQSWSANIVLGSLAALLGLSALAWWAPTANAQWSVAAGGTPARTGYVNTVGPTSPTRHWEGVRFTRYVRPIAVDGGRVFASWNESGSSFTEIVAFDITDGTELWSVEVPEPPRGAERQERSRITGARDGQVYATRSGGGVNDLPVYAYDAADGSPLWVSEAGVMEGPLCSCTFAPNGDLIIPGRLSSGHAGIIRIDKDDGSTVWESPPCVGHTQDANGEVVFGDTVYAWNVDRIAAIDLNTGSLRYQSDPLPPAGAAIQQGLFCGLDGKVYAYRTNSNLYALEDTGSGFVIRWAFKVGTGIWNTHGVGSDGSIYTQDGEQHVVRLDPNDASIIARSADPIPSGPDGPSARMAVDAAGNVFLANGSYDLGAIAAYDVDLHLLWCEYPGPQQVTGPALGPDGELVAQTQYDGMIVYKMEPECPGDVDEDGDTDLTDLAALLAAYGSVPDDPNWNPACDFDDDNDVDLADLATLLANYGCGA